MPQQLNLR